MTDRQLVVTSALTLVLSIALIGVWRWARHHSQFWAIFASALAFLSLLVAVVQVVVVVVPEPHVTQTSSVPPLPWPSSPAEAAPALADEFAAGSVPDTARWNVYTHTSPNESLWSPSAVEVGGGELRIVGTGRNRTGAGNVSGGMCWCGLGGNQLYGVWRVRARFDTGAGYGPEIGLWPESGRERDGILTFAQAFQPDRRALTAVVIWNGGTAGGRLDADLTAWHVYSVEWRAGAVRMFVDDTVVYDSPRTPGFIVPDKPMHLIMQQHTGPRSDLRPPDTSTPDRVVMHVDWVRYYR